MRIAVIASYAEDTIEIDGTTIVRAGGPAYFIAGALRNLGIPFDVYAGAAPARVRIRIRDGEEHGVVDAVPPIAVPAVIVADACIVSTVLNEFPVERTANLPGYVALDVQGYLRRSGGGRRAFAPSAAALARIACFKATDAELDVLNPALVAAQQRDRTLIVTHGAHGATVWHRGVAHVIPGIPVTVRSTLGAGDTFLSAFVVACLRGLQPEVAGRFAVESVVLFLTERNARSQRAGEEQRND